MRVVYRDATIFDGTGAAPSAGMSLVVDGDRIVDVVETGRLVVPDGAEVVDLAGRFVIPGLVDSHQHLATPPDRAKAEAWLRQMVYGGVTAIRDMADDLRQVGDLARACLVGEIPGPDIHYAALMAGPGFFDDPRTWQVSQGETPGPGALDAGDHRRDRPRHRHRARPRHPRQRDQGVRRPLHRPGRGDRDRGPPSGDARCGRTCRCSRRCPSTWWVPASTWSRTCRCWPGRPGPTRPRRTRRGRRSIPRHVDPDDPRIAERARRDGRARHDPRRHREHVGEPRGPRRGRRPTRSRGRRATPCSRRS